MRWARLTLGILALALGVVCLIPPLIALYISTHYFTLGITSFSTGDFTLELRPWWIEALLGGAAIVLGIRTLRHRSKSN